MKNIICLLLLFSGYFFSFDLSAQILLEWDSQWDYHKGTSQPIQQDALWMEPGFNSNNWTYGHAPFWYGDGTGGTFLDDMQYNYSTLFLRTEITINDSTQIDELKISLDYDDGIALWINGELMVQKNTPQDYSYNQFAPTNHESGSIETFTFLKEELNLVNGLNTIAVQGFNVSLTSSDFYVNARLEGIKRLPETDKVSMDIQSGFYTTPFTTNISSTQNGDTLRYTLDGSDPRYSSTAIEATAPVSIWIDPNSSLGGRGKTGGVVLRASKFKSGFDPGKPTTHTYLFLENIIKQANPGGSWPMDNVNGQHIDYPMDSRVTTHPTYASLLDDALLDIPSISITTDPDHLFNAQTGIYVNAQFRGLAWERPANIELIYADGTPGFNIDAGLRIRGGWSRHPEFAKHAFRLFFRSEYGEGKLRYPLFGEEGTDEYDKIDMRTSQNYSWSKGGWEGKHNTMNRDVFSRHTQRDMGQPYTRSTFYHLYLNGLYWGVYQSQERAEANFAESYLGGSKEDYDVVKVDVGDNWNVYEIEATDGTTDAWRQVWQMCLQGFSSNTNYFALMGQSANGEIDTTKKVLVDVDNLIDYMLIIFYGGNFDSPVSKFRNNSDPNNFYAIYNRNNPREGFKFIIHDAEHTLLTEAVGPGSGLYENRVNIGSTNQMNVTSFEKFHPQWLHHKLSANLEYRLRFADRVYRHVYQTGVFHPDSSISRFRETSDQLNLAIIAESARWGDIDVSAPRTRNDDWIPAVNEIINGFFPFRTDIVKDQLLNEDLYLTLEPPIAKKDGATIPGYTAPIATTIKITLHNPNTSGTIYYTLDGSDPRAIGGAVSDNAITAADNYPVDISPGSILKTRIYDGSTWSPMHELAFTDAALFSHIKITELHYNPLDQGFVEGKDLEFIELKNTASRALNVSGIAFTDGVEFSFPEQSIIDPGALVVLASNGDAFKAYYGISPDYTFNGNLSNSGEKITLATSRAETIFSFTYSDQAPWPKEADGDGYSLVSAMINPIGQPNSHAYWTTSLHKNGSPFLDDGASVVTSLPEYTSHTTTDLQISPNPTQGTILLEMNVNTAGNIEISLYDINGQMIRVLARELAPAGRYKKQVQLYDLALPSGLYFLTVRSSSNVLTRKLIYQTLLRQ